MAKDKLEPTGEKCSACGGSIKRRLVYQAFGPTRCSRGGWVPKEKFCEDCRDRR